MSGLSGPGENEMRAILELRRILSGLLSLPPEHIEPGTRLRADLDMTGIEIREFRIAILEETRIWLPFDPLAEHTLFEIGLILARARTA